VSDQPPALRRIQRVRVAGSRMQTDDGVRVVYVGRGGLWGNPYRYRTLEALARVPAADLVTPWEYEGRTSADGAQHDMHWPGGEVTRHAIRFMTIEEIIATYRRALIAPHKGLRLVKRHGGEVHHITVEMVRRELAGQHLACWCKPGAPCHGDVLLWAANAPIDEIKEASEKEYEILRSFTERVAALHPSILAGWPEVRDAA
jgi:Domain of unknown function (DUF4326)